MEKDFLHRNQLWKMFRGIHSRPHRPRSFSSAPGIETSGCPHHRKSAIHGLIVKSDKYDWLENTERALYPCSEIGTDQRSRSLAQTRRIADSRDENAWDEKSNCRTCAEASQRPVSEWIFFSFFSTFFLIYPVFILSHLSSMILTL